MAKHEGLTGSRLFCDECEREISGAVHVKHLHRYCDACWGKERITGKKKEVAKPKGFEQNSVLKTMKTISTVPAAPLSLEQQILQLFQKKDYWYWWELEKAVEDLTHRIKAAAIRLKRKHKIFLNDQMIWRPSNTLKALIQQSKISQEQYRIPACDPKLQETLELYYRFWDGKKRGKVYTIPGGIPDLVD